MFCSDSYEGWQMCPVAMVVGAVYFKTQIHWGPCVWLHAAWGQIQPVTRASPPLTSHSQEMTCVQSPHSHPSALLTPPSDMFRCGSRLPVSPSHAVSSEDLVSKNWRGCFPSGAEGGMYSTMEATTATCDAYSKDRWKQLPYWHNIIVLVFEVHRMRRTRWAAMTEENQPGPQELCNNTRGLMFLERSACVSSVAIEAAMTRPQCKGEGPGEVRDVQGSSMHNEYLSSAHSICG